MKGDLWSFDKQLLIRGVIKKWQKSSKCVVIWRFILDTNSRTIWDTCLRVWVKYWQAYWEILRIWWEELKLLASLYENSRVTWCSKAFEEDIKNKEAGKREVTEVQHKYERLGPFFFYLCGLMRHMDDSCRILLSLQEDDGTSWSEEILDNKFFSIPLAEQ